MNYLWLYLALCAAFTAGFMVCAMLSWGQIERQRRQTERRIKILETAVGWCLREIQEFAERRTGTAPQVPPEAIERHWRS